MGSSGGGFTAIALAILLRGRAFAINPQLICTNFWPRIVKKMKDTCLRAGEKLIEERLDVAKLADKEGFTPSVYLMINTASERDLRTQLQPFVEEMHKLSLPIRKIKLNKYFCEGGHSAMPDKQKCLQVIHEELSGENRNSVNQQFKLDPKTEGIISFKDFKLWNVKHYYKDSEVVEKADDICHGTMHCYRSIPGMKYDDISSFDWGATHSNTSNTFQLYLQAMNPVNILTRAYQITQKDEYLTYAMKLIESWNKYSKSEENRKNNRWVFRDHSVSLRANNLIYYGKVCYDSSNLDEENALTLYAVLRECGKWLALERNYTKNHNHGIMEDEALLHLGKLFRNSIWVERAKKDCIINTRMLLQKIMCMWRIVLHIIDLYRFYLNLLQIGLSLLERCLLLDRK